MLMPMMMFCSTNCISSLENVITGWQIFDHLGNHPFAQGVPTLHFQCIAMLHCNAASSILEEYFDRLKHHDFKALKTVKKFRKKKRPFPLPWCR